MKQRYKAWPRIKQESMHEIYMICLHTSNKHFVQIWMNSSLTHLYAFMPRGVDVYGACQKLCFEIHRDQIQQFL